MTNKDKIRLEKILSAYIGDINILKHAVFVISREFNKTYHQGKVDRNEELKVILNTKNIIEFSEFIQKKIIRRT